LQDIYKIIIGENFGTSFIRNAHRGLYETSQILVYSIFKLGGTKIKGIVSPFPAWYR